MPKKMTYTVSVEVAEQMPDLKDNGKLIEVISKKQVELMKLQRTNLIHSKLAMKLFTLDPSDADATSEIAVEFVKACCVDGEVAKTITKDLFACFSIYMTKEVREDINDFFGRWDITRTLIEKATEGSPEI